MPTILAAISVTLGVAKAGTTAAAARKERKVVKRTRLAADIRTKKELATIEGAEAEAKKRAAATIASERKVRARRARTILTGPRGAALAPGQVRGKVLLGE